MTSRLPLGILWRTSMRPSQFPRFVTAVPQRICHYSSPADPHQNRTAIVTGAARGIGKAIAVRLAQDGYDVCVNDVAANLDSARDVASTIQKTGRKAIAVAADVSKLSDVHILVQTSVDELGPLNTMVANAGIAQVKAVLDLTEEDLRRMFEINVFGLYNCYSMAAKQMIKQGGGGKILGAASIAAFKPAPLLSHYSASKWAVRGLTHAFALEMAVHKITVNAYAPGIVGTAMWDLIDEGYGKVSGAKKGETFNSHSNGAIALGRTSVPEDVSSTVSWLAGKDSDYVTGQTIVVDGGMVFT